MLFNIELAQSLINSTETYPVNLDDAVAWLGYTRKDSAVDTVKSYFEKDIDFIIVQSRKTPTGGRSSNLYFLTVDAFKQLGMLCKTSQGREVRRYFIECERLAKQAASNTPQTYIEALKALVASEEAKEQLALKNSILENQVESLEIDNERQAELVDELYEYSSIIRIAKLNNVHEKTYNWRVLKSTSQVLGVDILQAPDPNFGTRNLYSRQAWQVAYPDAILPELNSIAVYNTDL